MDKIFIRDLKARCIIGTRPEERCKPQTVLINLELDCSLARAGRTDRLVDTLNYKTLKDRLLAMVQSSAFFLIERMAQAVADMCLGEPQVRSVTVTVDKPGALTGARSVAVQIVRQRGKRSR